MDKEKQEALKERRFNGLTRHIRLYKADLAKRLVATRELFGQRVFAVEIHSHSNFSDGAATPEVNRACAENAGLDFLFATDHASLGQKRVVSKWANASWGQEPGAGGQHIGLLCGKRLFRPCCTDFAADFAEAQKVAPFAWVPHPVGWYPVTWYPDEIIEGLWQIGDAFAVEVMNGAGKTVRAYDAFDAKAVTVWDQLLCAGKRVTALGGSDAHLPDSLGCVWTGVYAPRLTAPSIIKTLGTGRCFASEASLMDFTCDGRPMGEDVQKQPGDALDLAFRVADSAGVASVRIVSQGKVIKTIDGKGRTVVEGVWRRKAPARPTYYRLESTASDDRRAFSTPIYCTR